MPFAARVAALAAAILAVLAAPLANAQDVTAVTRRGDAYVVSGATYEARFSAANGALVALTQTGKSGTLLASGEFGLWRARFRDGAVVSANDAGAPECEVDAKAASLRLRYRSPEIAVTVTVTASKSGLEFAADVVPAKKVLLDFELPARLRFDAAKVDRFVAPVDGNQGVGVAFRRAFFLPQPEDSPSVWQQSVAGTKGYEELFGGPLDQRADQDPAAALSVTADGKGWLGEALAGRLASAKAVVNRPPTRAQASLVLVDSPNGPWLSAHSLGEGRIWRIGGAVDEGERALALDSAVAVVAKLAASAPAGRTKLGVLALRNGPDQGGWAAVPVRSWLERLRALPVVRGGKVGVVEIATPAAIAAALASPEYAAILNPYGEGCPVVGEGMPATVAAIGRYTRAGGNWLEVGGYPFFYAMRPARFLTYSGRYPALFADFVHLDSASGAASIYRVQPLSDTPWIGAKERGGIFVPGALGCGADERGAYADRSFGVYVEAQATWRTPRSRIAVGGAAEADLAVYCRDNAIRRTLKDKVAGPVLDRLQQSVLVYYGGSAREKTENLGLLPKPTLIHFADYLHGGFDKQYPDHLPPNAGFGTGDDLRTFFDKARALGHLIMPYTNPTWWCDHPKGPTFEREGEAPLLKGLDGKPVYERYAVNDGWTVCHWHPAVQAANRKTVKQFSEEYPVDVLFQDQCGARGWAYDLSPASPTPYAYTDGLISMIAEDSRTKPLGTEAGWDRVVNWETQLCGMSFGLVPTEGGPEWRRYMKQTYPPQTWDVYPLAQQIAHDKAMMLHHDLGQFVTNRETLSWTLGLGFSLSYSVPAGVLHEDQPREWLRWLDRVQKSVVARYLGEPVRSFRHDRGANPTVADDGAISAAYGPVRLSTNLGAVPREVDGHALASHGFFAEAPGMAAGVTRSDAGEASFVVEAGEHGGDIWAYGPPEQSVRIALPARATGRVALEWDGGSKAEADAKDGALSLRLPARKGKERVAPPAELAGKAPKEWPGARPAVCVLDLAGSPGQTWTRIAPAQWLDAFRGSRLAREMGVPVRALTTLDELNAALAAGPRSVFAIVNPYGEGVPEAAPGQWKATLEAIRRYVEAGGCWWETAGYTFHSAFYLSGAGWQAEAVGPAGLATLGIPIGGGEVDAAAVSLEAAQEGRDLLGLDLRPQLATLSTPVNRALPQGAADPGHVTLVRGDGQDYIGGYRLNGWGWLWRIGGFWPEPKVALPVAVAATEALYTHAPLPVKAAGISYLWHAKASW